MRRGEVLKLGDLDLGFADGAEEAKMENFTDMYFVDDAVYNTLSQKNNVFIISGKKGTGKTILSRYYSSQHQEKHNSIELPINLTNFQFNKLLELGADEISAEELMPFLKFEMLVMIADELVEKNRQKMFSAQYIKYQYYMKKTRRFLKTRYPESNFHEKQVTREKTQALAIKGNSSALDISPQTSNTTRYEKFKQKHYSIIKAFEKLVCKLLELQTIIVITDDLDEKHAFNEAEKNYTKFLHSLITANKLLNSDILTKHNSKSIVIVRDDILESINSTFTNFNKIIIDSSIKLNWIETGKLNPCEFKIIKMIIKKVRVSLPEFEMNSDEEILEQLFPHEINQVPLYHYLMNNSFGRPRNVIDYLNIIIKHHSEATTFFKTYFINALPEYSGHLLGEVRNEMSFQHTPTFINQLFSLIDDINKSTFFSKDIDRKLENNPDHYSGLGTTKEILSVLYAFGIIGFASNKKSKTITIWAYRIDGKKTINFDSKFSVHHGLRKTLISK